MLPSKTYLGKRLNFLAQSPAEDIVSQLLESRGVKDTETFLHPSLEHLHDPDLLPDIQEVVERIKQAKKDSERVMIFGDYDADGVTSTAALFLFLRSEYGLQVSYRIPHRIEDGYGMKPYLIDKIHETGTSLIITVDCGTRDHESITHAKNLGIDVIVTDHHVPGDSLPEDAIAIINPHRKDAKYPFCDLSGAGVVLKIIQKLSGNDPIIVQKYIDICTIGTIADVMPLVGENRTIASLGLRQMSRSSHACFARLISPGSRIDGDTIGYQIGPLINAAGRMDTPTHAVQMLTAGAADVQTKIDLLTRLNNKRKDVTNDFYREALSTLDETKDLITYEGKIPHGIIGLVAGKLCQYTNRPAIVLAREEDRLVGSCRSPEFLNIVEVLEKFGDQFVSFGGHHQAAGFTVMRDRWKELEKKLATEIKMQLKGKDLTEQLRIDGVLMGESVDLKLHQSIDALAPFGNANEKPLFLMQDVDVLEVRKLGGEGRHIKIHTPTFDIVAWGWGEHFPALTRTKKLSPIGHLEINEFRGKRNVQVNMVDILPLS